MKSSTLLINESTVLLRWVNCTGTKKCYYSRFQLILLNYTQSEEMAACLISLSVIHAIPFSAVKGYGVALFFFSRCYTAHNWMNKIGRVSWNSSTIWKKKLCLFTLSGRDLEDPTHVCPFQVTGRLKVAAS